MIDENCFSTEETLSFLFLMIKYADDADVGQFLENIQEGLIDRDYHFDIYQSNKEFLLEYLILDTLFEGVSYKNLILKHLKYISKSFFSNDYYNSTDSESFEENIIKMKVAENRLEIICDIDKNGKIIHLPISFEEFFKFQHPKPQDFKRLFKKLVNIYTKHHFYFIRLSSYTDDFENKKCIKKESIYKIIPNSEDSIVNDDKIKYEVKTIKNKPTYLTDTSTGLDYDMHQVLLSPLGSPNRDRGYKDCVNSIDSIVDIFTKTEECVWCNPSTNNRAKILCRECKELKSKLERENVDTQEVETYIKDIKISDCKNLADLRKKRKKELVRCIKWLKDGDDSFKINGRYRHDIYDEYINKIKKIVNNYFKTTIEY